MDKESSVYGLDLQSSYPLCEHHLWVKVCFLLSILVYSRSLQSARRLWLTDRQLSFIASESLDDLGSWIKHRLDGAKSQQDKAEDILSRIEISAGDLRHQWNLQKASQLSVKSRRLNQNEFFESKISNVWQ